ncbi:ABC transporter permease [Ornithinibacillus bavariensis]|uniref:Peptide ABC transporter permease n=1 Tax=Ornithinibacillus bavariensis TaxID=545502 RepID=A0A919X8K0_9BACI|nr:ABC transporter permease [Ornithinibacillus bavariensis]GIO27014.1 peptide ABC transporter permease [Ornithinibacillus bavariensis]
MAYFIRRLFLLFITLVLVSLITFAVFQIIPGDPIRIMLGPEADETQIETLEKELGLDQPLHIQYVDWVGGAITGDFGKSIRFSRPVSDLIYDRIPITFSLAVLSVILVVIIAIPLGIYVAKKPNSLMDYALSTVTQVGMAIPSFWLGMLLILYLGMTFSFFQISGYVPWSESILGALGTLILPALTIAIPQIAVSFRYIRTSVLEQMQRDYVRTARSKGMREGSLMYRHVLRNAMIPILTVFGLIFAEVVAGTIIVEQVFGLPGLGSLLITAISYRDFPLVQGIVMYITLIVVFINFIIDILYSIIDPRIRL